jgi:hypothetical protein
VSRPAAPATPCGRPTRGPFIGARARRARERACRHPPQDIVGGQLDSLLGRHTRQIGPEPCIRVDSQSSPFSPSGRWV